jgi:hypothetical protein
MTRRPAIREKTDPERQAWGASVWSVVVRGGRGSQTFTPRHPVARIGSDRRCEIHLDDPQVPAAAYLLCAVAGGVEAWPLAPVAMAHSGLLGPGQELQLGAWRIAAYTAPEQTVLPAAPTTPLLEIDVEGQRWSENLSRPVNIVGEDHPSVIRIRAAGPNHCHGAFVSVAGSVWYVSIALEQPLRFVALPTDQIMILGRAKIRLLPNLPSPTLLKLDPQSAPEPSPTLFGSDVPDEAYIEGYTSHVTDRMLRMGRKKRRKRRIIRAVLCCIVSAIAAAVILRVYAAVKDELWNLF